MIALRVMVGAIVGYAVPLQLEVTARFHLDFCAHAPMLSLLAHSSR